MFTAGRIANVAARRSHIPKVLSYIDAVRFTPSLAIMLNAGIACIYLIPDASSFSTILDLFQFTTRNDERFRKLYFLKIDIVY